MRRRYSRGRKGIGFVFLFMLICMISLGYALLSSTLVIDGTANISKTTWDVHYENVKVTAGSVSASTPEILDDTIVKYIVNLSQPGQFYEFTVDVVNDGTLDAEIDKVVQTELTDVQKKYLSYSLSYDDGTEIKTGDKLLSKKSNTIKVRIEFMIDIEADDLPAEADTINMKLETRYVQVGVEINSDNPSEDNPTDNPNIDESKYWDCGDDKIEGYKCLKFEWTQGKWWSSDKTIGNGLSTSSTLGPRYWATQVFEKQEIPNGSMIKIASGWTYRPEGWISLTTANTSTTRPPTKTVGVTVDDTWWGDYNYRAFNVNMGSTDISEYTEEQINAVFKVYIPIDYEVSE